MPLWRPWPIRGRRSSLAMKAVILAAGKGTRMKAAKWRLIEKGPEVAGQARVVVSDCEGCPRYFARIVRGVKVGPSPEWLVNRLEQAGQRSINKRVGRSTGFIEIKHCGSSSGCQVPGKGPLAVLR